jgi:hypothetical protein
MPIYAQLPFPDNPIFDSLRQFDPVKEHKRVLSLEDASSHADLIEQFYIRLSYALCQMRTISWLYQLWNERMNPFLISSKDIPEEHKRMTAILLRALDHVDTGKRFHTKDSKDDVVFISGNMQPFRDGYTGASLDDMRGSNRAKKSAFKSKFSEVFIFWKFKDFKLRFLTPFENCHKDVRDGELPPPQSHEF